MKTISWLVSLLALTIMVVSCVFIEDDEAGENPAMVEVTLKIDGPTSRNSTVSYNDGVAGPPDFAIRILGDLTVMIIAVPDTVTSFDTYTDLTGYLDRQLLDLSDNTVRLTLPFGTSVRLVEVIFSGQFSSVAQIDGETPVANRVGISEPFAIESGTGDRTVVVNLISQISDKEKTEFTQTELNAVKMMSVSGLLETGFGELDNSSLKSSNVIRAKVYFADAASKSGNLTTNDADTARFFSAFTRIAAIVYNSKSDGDTTDDIEDA
ncbi:MAG: hypothetical protein GY866_26730, partial [Proteobacteria bacterium]|nr:hypothetical protein [Pseudomonadota bacterium]